MTLPFVIDIAIGLIFVFLILSLLASELQELLATLLQWRAKHLKDSIEIFLAGGIESSEDARVKDLVANLYNDPLIKNINQEAKGSIARGVREVTRWIPSNRKGAFGRGSSSGPSYINSETFATSLLERLGLATLTRKLTEVRLERFMQRIIGQYEQEIDQNGTVMGVKIPHDDQLKDNWEKGGIRVIAEKSGKTNLREDANFVALVEEFDDALADLKAEQATLDTCVERLGESLNIYIAAYPIELKSDRFLQPEPQASNSQGSISLPAPPVPSESEIGSAVGKDGAPTQAMASPQTAASTTVAAETVAPDSLTDGFDVPLVTPDAPASPSLTDRFDVAPIASESTSSELTGLESTSSESATPESASPEATSLESTSSESAPSSALTDGFDVPLVTPDAPSAPPSEAPAPISDKVQSVSLPNESSLTTRREDLAYFVRRLKSYKQSLFGETNERAIRSGGLRPSLFEIAELVDQTSNTYQEVAASYQTIVTQGQPLKQRVDERAEAQLKANNPDLDPPLGLKNLNNEDRRLQISAAMQSLSLSPIEQKLYYDYETYESIQEILKTVPASVKESLAILARRAQSRVQEVRTDLDQFREEVSLWFDSSMSRASGVYKRNAKGVAITIGVLLATVTNTDAFFIVNRLSNDGNLRQVITQQAGKITTNAGASALDSRRQIEALKDQTDAVLQDLAVPVGWSATNLRQQLGCNPGQPAIDATGWEKFVVECSSNQQETGNVLIPLKVVELGIQHPVDSLRVILGWLISGLAIAMGAPFWFDLLGKIMNVRNSGGKPASESATPRETAK